jgi:hypothetical protein
MDNEVDIVQKDPLAFLVSFDVQRANSAFAESFIDAFGDRLIVSTGCTGADDEVVGERAHCVQLEDHDILRLLIEGGFKSFGQIGVGCFLSNGFYLTNRVDAC